MAAYLYTIGKLYLNEQKNKLDKVNETPKISDLVGITRRKSFELNYETSLLEINEFNELESDSDYNTSEEN